MTFFSRPSLDNLQFKQEVGDVLELNGQTQIKSPTGLTLTNGVGTDVIITATGATNGYVMTYNNGLISLKESVGGSGAYSGASPTTCSVGGLTCGSAILNCSISNILERILVPDLPLVSSLCVNPIACATRQFGNSAVGTLCWYVTKKSNPIKDIYLSTNSTGTYNCTILSSGCKNVSTGSTVAYSFTSGYPTPTTACTKTVANYCICARSTENEVSTTATTITWMNKTFCFGNSTVYNTVLVAPSMCNATYQSLSCVKTLDTSFTLSNQFFYYAYPKSMGVPTFNVNGLTNTAWGNVNLGTLFTITFVNTNGYSNQYYVARSDNRLTGTYCIKAS